MPVFLVVVVVVVGGNQSFPVFGLRRRSPGGLPISDLRLPLLPARQSVSAWRFLFGGGAVSQRLGVYISHIGYYIGVLTFIVFKFLI